MRKVYIVTPTRLKRVRRAVTREMEHHGLWNRGLAAVEVRLVPLALCYGWQAYGTTGEIGIPVVSACRLRDWWQGRYTTLRDVLRHE